MRPNVDPVNKIWNTLLDIQYNNEPVEATAKISRVFLSLLDDHGPEVASFVLKSIAALVKE